MRAVFAGLYTLDLVSSVGLVILATLSPLLGILVGVDMAVLCPHTDPRGRESCRDGHQRTLEVCLEATEGRGRCVEVWKEVLGHIVREEGWTGALICQPLGCLETLAHIETDLLDISANRGCRNI